MVVKKIDKEYKYCFVIKKSKGTIVRGQLMNWINIAALKRDFSDFMIFYDVDLQKISDDLVGQMIGFKLKSDAIRFKLSLPRYIKIKNHNSLYFEYHNDVEIKIKELTILQKVYNESRLSNSELNKAKACFEKIIRNDRNAKKLRDFAKEELERVIKLIKEFGAVEYSKVEQKISEIKQLIGVMT